MAIVTDSTSKDITDLDSMNAKERRDQETLSNPQKLPKFDYKVLIRHFFSL